jgi:hypothetical protein
MGKVGSELTNLGITETSTGGAVVSSGDLSLLQGEHSTYGSFCG